MRQSCVWSIVALSAILLCLQIVNGAKQKYKQYELGGRAVDEKFCGNRIMSLYMHLCSTGNRKRRSMFLDEREALSFFQHQTQRHRRDANPAANPTTSTTANPTTSTGTDVVEECCVEGCAYEEMYEYCWWTERTLKYEEGVNYSVSTRSAAITSRTFNVVPAGIKYFKHICNGYQ